MRCVFVIEKRTDATDDKVSKKRLVDASNVAGCLFLSSAIFHYSSKRSVKKLIYRV